jgi:NTE family protein
VNALQASFALPGIFRPVKINGRWLIDGALVNPIPVSVCRALGARMVIAVNLSCDLINRGTVIHDQANFADPTVEADDSTLPGKNGRAALHLLHRQIFGRSKETPGISSVMMDAINITQDRIARSRLAGDPPDVSISPKTGHIGLFDFHRANEAIELGARAAEKQIEEIRMALGALAA